jgi:hypothetical protein
MFSMLSSKYSFTCIFEHEEESKFREEKIPISHFSQEKLKRDRYNF